MIAKIEVLYGNTDNPLVTIRRPAAYKQVPATKGNVNQIVEAWTSHLEKLGYTVTVIQ